MPLLLLLPLSAAADAPPRGGTPASADPAPRPSPACSCRYEGGDYPLGARVCIRGRMARCDLVLNNTSWTLGETPCGISSLPGSRGTGGSAGGRNG